MWIIFGVSAIIAAVFNVIWTIKGRDSKWFRFISISLTAFTVCAEYSLVNTWVKAGDMSALMDVVPGMTGALWICVTASIIINSISLFRHK